MFSCFQFLLFCVGLVCVGTLALCFSNENPSIRCLDVERRALLDFKEGLKDPRNRLSSWVGEDCCSWRGIRCNNKTGHVVKLNLRNPYQLQSSMPAHFQLKALNYSPGEEYDHWCLSGEIRHSLLSLEHLNHIDLSRNDFKGMKIPKFMGSFKRLRYLNLSKARFGGLVPHELGNLSRLNHLDFSNDGILKRYDIAKVPIYVFWKCTYDLRVDSLHWVSDLSSLKHLNMTGVNLSMAVDWLSSINMIPSIQNIDFAFCDLGTISSTPTSLPLISNFTSLTSIDLFDNALGPKIPTWLFNISSLLHLDLGFNNFNDSISNVVDRFCTLSFLRLVRNKFWGDMNQYFGENFLKCNRSRLEYLDLAVNKLSGHLPDWLGQFTNLKSLLLNGNSFSGPIPKSLAQLTSLEILDFSRNQLEGTIPESFGKLSNLVSLHLGKNSFEGFLSETHFSNLTNLESLILSSNLFALNVSSVWIPPLQLKYIAMDDTKLGPRFPLWLRTQIQIEYISMSNANISGKIPHWFWNISSNLMFVDLSDNSLLGSITANIGSMAKNMLHLSLSSNLLHGHIPASLCKMKCLLDLHLSNNYFSNKIPHCLGDQMLHVLDLANNSLSDEIPSGICNSQLLKSLHLSNNKLSGQFPSSLKHCSDLITLDLGGNRISGEIPTWLGENLSNLKFLILKSNKFEGNIPRELSLLSQLQVLDLSLNNLSGRIPSSFGDFNSMATTADKEIDISEAFRNYESISVSFKGNYYQYGSTALLVENLDLSGNDLFGPIPEEITRLVGLQSLNMSRNRMSGFIPKKIGNMQRMESLDLSCNQLLGAIPLSLANLTFLSHLNLSYNNLSGRIPSGRQLDTLLNTSVYIGNLGLCGPPLSNECPGDGPSQASEIKDGDQEGKDRTEVLKFFTSMSLGFVLGFWIFCGPLLFMRPWRIIYFHFIDYLRGNIYEVIVRKMVMF